MTRGARRIILVALVVGVAASSCVDKRSSELHDFGQLLKEAQSNLVQSPVAQITDAIAGCVQRSGAPTEEHFNSRLESVRRNHTNTPSQLQEPVFITEPVNALLDDQRLLPSDRGAYAAALGQDASSVSSNAIDRYILTNINNAELLIALYSSLTPVEQARLIGVVSSRASSRWWFDDADGLFVEAVEFTQPDRSLTIVRMCFMADQTLIMFYFQSNEQESIYTFLKELICE